MPLSLRQGVVAFLCLIVVFHIADNSLQYQRCLLQASNQQFPDFKLVMASPQCNGLANGGLFRLFPKPLGMQLR
ncbi:hypothetical protein [Synechococcus sp. A15-60]|uniref:hypothetical protein n=1 Tax=Synechococcus sp. A15-60 TaxID=1050655 RepID=UPI000C3D8F4F|nr:hypothetical protein [Synechococcus sp. A15-60]MAN18534.1 hypothetical protein [Synechococcus sp. EAC657]QNI48308.1 putative conserved secreted protein [Synechococcus sp. A15-60]|tara:strand:- start:1304 stop:1525 length:222 start_codon:yes stop_codon:yes gene_type:complete